jgi:hypothetical protein
MTTKNFDELRQRRLTNWRQTATTKIQTPDEAAELINNLGVATLYAASPEIPNLFSAYVGNPDEAPAAEWDSPSGHVYGWRWELGRPAKAFYSVLVRKRPTWVSWEMLPAILRLKAEFRSIEEIYQAGELPHNARRVGQALEEAPEGVLSTGELRQRAGFPTGKENRAAYLKAVEELDSRLVLAKVFSPDDTNNDMSHALIRRRFAEHFAAAEAMSEEDALQRFLQTYIAGAVYVLPTPLAKHLNYPEAKLRTALAKLTSEGKLEEATFPEHKGICYVVSS